MEVKLVMTGGKGAAQEVVVTGPRFFIGRAEDCQLRPRSDLISRHHCVILQEEGLLLVRDLGSKNGTFVNGQRVVTEAELHSGDLLKVGPLEFEVRVVGAPAAAPPSKPATPPPPEPPAAKKPKVRSVQEAAARTVGSATGPADEDDVSHWLYEDEVSGSLTETNTMEPTRAAKAPAAPEPPKAAQPPVPPEEEVFEGEEPEEKPKSKAEAFQIPTKPKGPATGSSKESAADALKSFFKRK